MNRFGIIVHGGAGPDAELIRKNAGKVQEGIVRSRDTAYELLDKGASAVEAVEAAIMVLEDDPLFNAGRGSALNAKGAVEMDAAVMNGSTLSAGAIACVKWVKNPVSLARAVMERTAHVLIVGEDALQLAHQWGHRLEQASYFITPHQYQEYLEEHRSLPEMLRQPTHGTVGAVAIDRAGNLAAAASTGGIPNSLAGRVGDSCIIGGGCYANNDSCAVSSTGDGELLMTRVVAHSVAYEWKILNHDLQLACDTVIHPHVKLPGDAGVICIDKTGAFGFSFNTERMPRGWRFSDEVEGVGLYR